MDDDLFTYRDDRIRSLCLYKREGFVDPEHDTVLEDHFVVDARIALFRDRADSVWNAVYPDLPIASEDLDDWAVALQAWRDMEEWGGRCEPGPVCAEGQRPVVRTDAWESTFAGFVGDLEFYVAVVYISEHLPSNVQELNLLIFRELVLAEVDRRAKREPG